eukprot:61047_1
MSQRGIFSRWSVNKQHGFISPDNNYGDIYVDVNDMNSYALQPGEYVKYNTFTQNDGRRKAVNVERCYDKQPSQTHNNNNNNNNSYSHNTLNTKSGILYYQKQWYSEE